MTAAWMVYAIVVGALIAVAAHAAEQAARALRLPRRGVWLLAMGATLAAPVAAALLDWRAPAGATRADEGAVHVAPTILVSAAEAVARTGASLGPAGEVIAAAWLASSVVAALLLARTIVLLHRRRRGWTVQMVGGDALLVAPDVGPAVVGVRRMQVVLPQWALALDDRLLAMMLRHEAEHVAARDPALLLAAAIALVLTPWNVALWWQARRLRLAVEIDCDARVLRAHADVERYGLLLLAVAQRRHARPSLLSPALLEPVSLLERRIAAMTARPARRPWIVAAASSAAAATALFVACAAPAPDRERADITSPSAALTAVPQVPAAPLAPDAPPAPPAPDTPPLDEVRRVREGDRVAAARQYARLEARARASSEAAATTERALPTEQPENATYFEFQVEKPVVGAAQSGFPRYPAELKAASVEGTVQVQFVVDTTGHIDESTFKVLRSDHALFTDAVREALPRMRFVPAEIGGRRVKQMVQQPFQFALSR